MAHRIFCGLLGLMKSISWPIAAITLAVIFRKPIIGLMTRVHKIKATSKGAELVLHELEKQGRLSTFSRLELEGLTAHDIWALQSFESGTIPIQVDLMKPAQRVAARTLVDLGILSLVGEGPQRHVEIAPLGFKILEAAKSISL
jgi:hypothetical protein